MNWQPKNPDFKRRIETYLEKQHFMKYVGMVLCDIEPGYITAELDVQTFHRQQVGFLHGGVSATICDIVAGFAAFSLVPDDTHVVTGELKISYLEPGRGSKVRATGKVIRPGRTLSFCEAEVEVYQEDRWVLIAKATTTMVNIPNPVT
jgi:uncharacterized protein (TIGR00369 family)